MCLCYPSVHGEIVQAVEPGNLFLALLLSRSDRVTKVWGGVRYKEGEDLVFLIFSYAIVWLNVSRVEVGEKNQDSLEFQLFVVSMHVCLDFFGVPWYTKRRESCILQSTFSSWCIVYFHM